MGSPIADRVFAGAPDHRRADQPERDANLSGIIGILLSLILWASLPVTAVWLLGVLLGIDLICEGAALGYLAWQVRQS
jgi:uncharacterized membrane protein HdeD (DUF308 family)